MAIVCSSLSAQNVRLLPAVVEGKDRLKPKESLLCGCLSSMLACLIVVTSSLKPHILYPACEFVALPEQTFCACACACEYRLQRC